MPNIDLSILNQRQTPAFFADTLANRPAAGFLGRIFVSTDTYAFYRDNGTSWDLIGGPGTGTITGSGAAGQVTYFSGASSITGNNNLFYDTALSHLGINTNTPGAAIDVHSTQSTIMQLNQTSINDSRIAFQLSGSALWRVGNVYNGGANDFGIFDVVGAVEQFRIKKTTGQTLIGGVTSGSGKLVVASATSDNGVQVVGANAPSLRIDNVEVGATKRAGLGIATAVNNFIQGSVDRDFCIFNGSTTAASPMLFGIYDAGLTNVQEAARISAARNFLVGGTTDNGAKLQVTGNGFISGSVGIGNTPLVTASLYIGKNITGGTSAFGLAIDGIIQSDVTTNAFYYRTDSRTAAASFLLSNLVHYQATQGAFGAGSSVGTQSGFRVTNNVIGATNNYAFWGQIPSGANRWNLYMDGTANNYMAGSLGIGSTSLTGVNLFVSKTLTGSVDSYHVNVNGIIQSDVTNSATYFRSSASTAATAFAVGSLFHYVANQGSLGAGSSIGTQTGFQVNANLIGATNNYGFRGLIPSGTGRWNLYMDGTANNYLNGNLLIGTATSGGSKLRIVGLPTSSAGLSSGDIWDNAGVLNIVP